MTQVAGRPLRADARRNRERVLKAAREVFSEQGREAQMDDVARRAMVGVGTVYRHFPTKEALLDALALDAFERILAVAIEQLARDDDDPWDAFTHAVWAGAEVLAGDRALSEVMAEIQGPIHVDEALQQQMAETMTTLIERAQAAGALRPDVVLDDVVMVICGIGTATRKPHVCRDAWRRHVAIVLDGMRASNALTELAQVSCS
jgi:AcrR family transcriptional regulator